MTNIIAAADFRLLMGNKCPPYVRQIREKRSFFFVFFNLIRSLFSLAHASDSFVPHWSLSSSTEFFDFFL